MPFEFRRDKKVWAFSIDIQMTAQIIAIDLGTRSTKAVCLQQNGNSLSLLGYSIQDRPDFGKILSREALAKHLNRVIEELNSKSKDVIFVVGATDALICHAEMPILGNSEMRKMVKLSPKLYFQEDLPNHSFDCLVLHQGADVASPKRGIRKARTLIVAVKNQILKNLTDAAAVAKINVAQVTASQTGAANCFLTSPEASQKKVVALADIGFSHSTISLLVNGEITLTRVVNIGADKFTSGLAEAMNITYAVAEGLKQIMPDKVHSQLKSLILPLCQELSNSIHFFEQQQDEKVSEIYVSGGSTRSNFIVEILQSELMLPCKSWDPTSSLKIELPPAQAAALKQAAPQLTVALGAAFGWFKTDSATVDLLAEQKELAEMRSRDPMKRAYAIAASLVVLLLIWCVIEKMRAVGDGKLIQRQTAELNSLQEKFAEADLNVKKSDELAVTLSALDLLAAKRFLAAPPLNALQYAVVENFQAVRLQINQQVTQTKTGTEATNINNVVGGETPEEISEQTTFTIQAKSFAKPSAAETFVGALGASPWFKANLRSEAGIRLKENQSPVVDANDPSKMTILFTVECYAERKL